MKDTIEKLLILQDRDRNIRRMEREVSRMEPERQELKTKASLAQTHLENAKTHVRQIESSRKDLELEVEAKKEQIARYANQQMQTRKNEEYRALAHEIQTCKDAIFKIENQEIELMEQAEAGQKEIVRANQAVNEARKLLEEQVAQLDAREKNLRNDLAELQKNRGDIASAVSEAERGRYERLMRSKGESVVVGVEHGVCGGCHMRLPPQILVACKAESELVTCSNCARILYYTPDMDLAVAD
jgi:uncharacterized protein